MTLRQTVLSASQIGQYRRCSLAWFLRYRCNLKFKPPAVLLKGRAVHAGIAAGLNAKIQSGGAMPPVDVVMQAAADTVDQHAPFTVFEDGEQPGDLKDRTVRLAALHHKVIMPQIQPALVEEELRYEIAPGIQMLGFVDCVETDGTIRDAKVSGRRPTEDNGLAVDFQLASYVMGVEAQGIPATKIVMDHLVDLKSPVAEPVVLDRAAVDTDRARAVAQSVAHQIATQQVVPTDDMKTCSWCEFRKICHGHKWWRYVREPVTAMDAARLTMPEALLPPDAPR
jgi:CRISPR/Cas system-associated exonuclease Cas4 (RecB family)